MFCRKCGAEIEPGAKFCRQCGMPIETEANDQPAEVQQLETAPQPEPVQQAAPTQEPVAQPEPVQQAASTQEPITQPEPQPTVQPQQEFQFQPQTAAQSSRKKGKTGLIIGIVAAVAVLVVGGIIYAINHHNRPNTSSKRDREEEEEDDDRNGSAKKGAVRTVMIYMLGTDLETYGGFASGDIDEMLAADIPDNVNLVIECGGAEEWQNDDIPDGEVTRFTVKDGELVKVEELGETTMTREGDLADFISFAAEKYPADSYTLSLWDHGGGIPVGFGCDELGNYEDMMTDYEIHNELESAGVTFDAIIFDACNVCTLEMANAIKDYASYMVGAESYVNGVGMYYTNWLSITDGDPLTFSEKIADDYIAYIHEEDMVGTMSVIRLDKINGVYNAYIDYIDSVNRAINAGDYAGYVKARSNCGGFYSSDFVDLLTLVSNYNTEKSTPVINSIIGAIEYTSSDESSDFTAGHGIVVYSPIGVTSSSFFDAYDGMDSFYFYEDGRQSFINLDYDPTILNFYDTYLSRNLAFQGQDMVAYLGGTWYTGDYSAEVANAGGEASSHMITPIDAGAYYAHRFSADEWDIISAIEFTVLVEMEDSYMLLGNEYTGAIDSEDRLALVDPSNWTYVNGDIACYIAIESTDSEDGSWSQTGVIPITVNGENAFMMVYYDNEYPYGTVLGYCLVGSDWETSDDYIYEFEESDRIDLVYIYIDDNGNEIYESNGSPFTATNIYLDYDEINLDEYITYGGYIVHDVYGNTYETDDYYPLAAASAVE